MEGYKVDKKIANLMCDMGFLMSEEPRGQHQRLVKKTDRHMIVVTYKVRRRLITSPLNAKDEFAKEIQQKQIEGESFGEFLKRHGLVPPDMMGYNDDDARKEFREGISNPAEHLLDDEDDRT